jgi:hypothetical protein
MATSDMKLKNQEKVFKTLWKSAMTRGTEIPGMESGKNEIRFCLKDVFGMP